MKDAHRCVERTRRRVNEGANCPVCLNDATDRLRGIDRINSVDSSIGEECIAIDHEKLTEADLIAWIGESLHGVAMASNEIVMNSVAPTISVLPCEHGSDHSSRPDVRSP